MARTRALRCRFDRFHRRPLGPYLPFGSAAMPVCPRRGRGLASSRAPSIGVRAVVREVSEKCPRSYLNFKATSGRVPGPAAQVAAPVLPRDPGIIAKLGPFHWRRQPKIPRCTTARAPWIGVGQLGVAIAHTTSG
jgi:hypothetical protein